MMRKVMRKRINQLPNLGEKLDIRAIPVLSPSDYQSRVTRIQDRMGSYTHLVIYGDREHFSNMEYFTGFDPRFEEALLVIPRKGIPSIIVGNEGDIYSDMIGYEINKYVYTPFSLPGQPRHPAHSLESILKEIGLGESSHVGLIGWKVFSLEDGVNPETTYDFPFFIMESLLKIVPLSNISNAIELMVGLDAGARITLGTKELLLSEIAGTLSSRNTYQVIKNLREGMTEIEASQHLNISGIPLSVHPNVNFGKNLTYGLASPQAGTKLKYGDVVGIGMAYRRTLIHKVGYYIDNPEDEPAERKEFYDIYFRSIAAWYETLRIGVSGGEMYDAVKEQMGELAAFGVSLNPGHLIHTDEWTNTPFQPNCKSIMRSGMMIQCDFTAARAEENLIAHAEDGVVLADAKMRDDIAASSPAAWRRIQERRAFMQKELGISLSEDVLPTSDLQGVIFPYMGDLNTILSFE